MKAAKTLAKYIRVICSHWPLFHVFSICQMLVNFSVFTLFDSFSCWHEKLSGLVCTATARTRVSYSHLKHCAGRGWLRGFGALNRPLPSSKNPHFQNEARCTTFLLKMSFICMRMKKDFHIKGWAPTLVLIQRPGGTRKWLIPSSLLNMIITSVLVGSSPRSYLFTSAVRSKYLFIL